MKASATGLFRPDRISLFAASDMTYARMYLIWFDETDDPEVWAYDTNGEARYENLHEYLQMYMGDDISPYKRQWRLSGL